MLPHLSDSPNLTPSDYHLFGAMKEMLKEKHYGNTEEMKATVRNWLCKHSS